MKYLIIVLNLICVAVYSQTDTNIRNTCEYDILDKNVAQNTTEIVVFNNEEPLISASIQILDKNSNVVKSTITDINGFSKLGLDQKTDIKDKIVKISFIGYKTCSIKLSDIIGKKIKIELTQKKKEDKSKDPNDNFEFIPVEG